MSYSDAFRARSLERMLGPERVTARRLAHELGLPRQTLSRWRRDALMVPAMATNSNDPGKAKSPREWSVEEKLKVVLEATALSEKELGPFLRAKGLHAVTLEQWRASIHLALSAAAPVKKSADSKRIRELERDLLRKDRALAEVTALLALKKKLEAIWGDEDDDTTPKSAR